MKISVLGNIIDTKDIYMITPVIKPAGDRKFNDAEWSGDRESDWRYQFTIKFFNDKSKTILEDAVPAPTKEDMVKYKNSTWDDFHQKRLNELRDKIVVKWNDGQTDIPKIEF